MMKYYIGIDLGGTNIVAGVVDEQFQLIAKASEKTLVGRPAIEIAKSMAKAARTAAQNAGVPMEQIEMVGIGSPGIVDNQKKEVIYASNLYFQNVPIGKMVEDELHKPVFIANDADAAAYGEFMAGAGRMKDGKHISNMLAITLGTGVGSGIIINSKIYNGYGFAGGEFGHSRSQGLHRHLLLRYRTDSDHQRADEQKPGFPDVEAVRRRHRQGRRTHLF